MESTTILDNTELKHIEEVETVTIRFAGDWHDGFGRQHELLQFALRCRSACPPPDASRSYDVCRRRTKSLSSASFKSETAQSDMPLRTQ